MGTIVVNTATMTIRNVGGNMYEGDVREKGDCIGVRFELRGDSVHVAGKRVGDVLQNNLGVWLAVPVPFTGYGLPEAHAVVHWCRSAIEAAALLVAREL